jgi:hypothetical protein
MVGWVRRVIRLGFWVVAMTVASHAHAAYNLYVYESGPDVLAHGRGTLAVGALTPAGSTTLPAETIPNIGMMLVGTAPISAVYTNAAGPLSLGPGSLAVATSSSGDSVGFQGVGGAYVVVPDGYVDGTFLNSRATWAGTTLAGLGLDPGTYTFTWAADSLTVHIGVAPPFDTSPPSIPALAPLADRARRRARIARRDRFAAAESLTAIPRLMGQA